MLTLKPLRTKRFGQHFLHDNNYIDRMVKAANLQMQDCVVEIGPGGGALTTVLLPLLQQLIAIEIDTDLYYGLQEKFKTWKDRLYLYHADALTFDLNQLDHFTQGKIRVMGNLPYNVATPLLFHWLTHRHKIQDCHVMLQKEVVDRLAATPGNKVYGRLSVMMQYYCMVEPLFTIPPGAFSPPPKVQSAVVRLTPRLYLPIASQDENVFSTVVKAAFSQRRKTILNSLRQLNIDSTLLERCDIDPTARAEALSVKQYVQLSNQYKLESR